VELYIKETFSAAHFLPEHEGACQNLHGHTWKVEVWLTGTVEPRSGMVIDFGDIKKEIRVFDHRCINNQVDYVPTAENIAADLLQRIMLYSRITSAKVRVWESENAYAKVSSL